jgi:acyl dehydratase
MAKSEQDRLIDEWAARQNEHIGEIHIPRVGEYPPDLDGWYGTITNEWITTDTIRHFADGMGDRNPLWRRHDYARQTRWGGIIAPPTISDTIIQPYSGNMRPNEYIPKFKTYFSLPNGSGRQMFQVVRPGDRFRAVQIYLGLKEVEPTRPSCRMFEETVRRVLINQREEVVAIHDRYMDVVINFPVDDDHPYWMKRRKRRLTDAERDAIQRGYDEATRRGVETLYWEDVKVGEELKPLTVGPISVYDIAACYTAISGHAVAFDLEWERIKLIPDFHWLDPEVNAWTCGGICHFQDNKGHAMIFDGGAAVGFYCQVEWVIGRMITDWMGDDGFLKKLDDRCPIYPILGDVLCCKGRVARKYIDKDEHLLDLEVRCENLDGLVLMPGSATVRLPSRADLTAY